MTRIAVIAGVGLSDQARSFDERSSFDVMLQAMTAALADARIEAPEVDGINAAWPGPGGTVFMPGSPDWANVLAARLTWSNDSYPQGIPALLTAAAVVEAGLCEIVLVANGQAGTRKNSPGVMPWTQPKNPFTAPYGSTTPAQFALIANRYRHEYGLEEEDLATVSAQVRSLGDINPEAVTFGRGPVTIASVLASPMFAEPLRLFDICLATEGAAAFVVTTHARAQRSGRPPVRLLAGRMQWLRQQYVGAPRFEESFFIGQAFADDLFQTAQIDRSQVNVFELYDPTSFEIIRQFEVLGFCPIGEGPRLIRELGLGIADGLPTNTDGGLLGFSHPGFAATSLKIIEAVRQLRGESGERQVPGAQVALATGAGSAANYYQAALLGAD